MQRRGRSPALKRRTVLGPGPVNEAAERLLSLCGQSTREGTVLIAEEAGEVVGVAVWQPGVRSAEVLALVTDPNHRHRGVARELVLELARRARAAGCTLLRVRLRKSDDGAVAFFRALGFDDTHLALDLSL